MSLRDTYTIELNRLLRFPHGSEKLLLSAIEKYSTRIDALKAIVFLSDKNELKYVYDSAGELLPRIEQLLNDYTALFMKLEGVLREATIVYGNVRPKLQICHRLEQHIDMHELQGHLALIESSLLAARVLEDKHMLVESLRQYLCLIYTQKISECESTQSVLVKLDCHKTCVDSLMFLIEGFEDLLKKLEFPIIVSDALNESDIRTWCDDDLQTFARDFHLLASLNVIHINSVLPKPLSEYVCLPIQIILNPLEKRFRYHFYGDKKTNSWEKPEWYMSQVLQWIRRNDYFLTVVGRDFVSCSKDVTYNLRLEFLRGMVRLLLDKLYCDLGLIASQPSRYNTKIHLKQSSTESSYRSDDPDSTTASPTTITSELVKNIELFSHLIDVVLQTDTKLTQLGYPLDQPRLTDALTHPKVFVCWLSLEQQLASDRLLNLLKKPASWIIVDKAKKRPQCVDEFTALIYALNLRGRQLSDKTSRVRFFHIQLNLIGELFDCLQSIARHDNLSCVKNRSVISTKATRLVTFFNAGRHSISSAKVDDNATSLVNDLFDCLAGDKSTCGYLSLRINVLNALQHVHDTILEWTNDQYYIAFWEDLTSRNLIECGDPWMIDTGLVLPKVPIYRNSLNLPRSTSGLHAGVFGPVLELYSKNIDLMLDSTMDTVLADLKVKASCYINASDHWNRASSMKCLLGRVNDHLVLSPNASSFLLTIRDWLFNFCESMHPKLFGKIWKKMAASVDKFLYYDLILVNRFSPLGAAQLRFDLSNFLYPLFSHYTDSIEVYFPHTRDACTLLNLLRGSAELLKETLKTLEERSTGESINPLAPLLELGVYNLTPEEALRVIDLRTFTN